ncbi:MAG: tRNA uracil 4-sulfurtransferase ThiI [Methanobrevibacter sp.]|uniref:tRNA uracil 4-sulfurtransferase ThiI n=1 Tax=Methanobrevibacter sp. TaxID=66852 RepID=UPI0026E0DD59|nr:tRNA uracil 4-sulfurtransferase ThiI [Methanobrevibacter sp.]MDO5848438.1 tRNA uracil 4-sulfurtransferase ThiI [Methanobrevibacter sp.]
MDYTLIIVRYGEIGLKSPKVRSRFERKLVKNIKAASDCEVERSQGRIYVYPKNMEETLNKLNKIFGIVSYSPAVTTYTNTEDIDSTLEKYVDVLLEGGILTSETTFAIKCRRVGNHDFTSQEMAGHCGAVVVRKVGCPVDLTNPELTIYVEIRDNETFIYHEKVEGPGGLPLGTQGKVISLLSSGIDSPVATYMMMKRGCEVIALHFDAEPYTKPKSREKFDDLVDALNVYAAGVPIQKRIVKFGDYLKKCKDDAPEKMTCVLCKSGMYQVASKLAEKTGALALVDGSSVGQVASQTLANILATRNDSEYPILSPLIGLDKSEIQKIAEKIGTFEISKVDDGGCDAAPRYPETKADIERVNEAKDSMNQKEAVEEAFNNISKE